MDTSAFVAFTSSTNVELTSIDGHQRARRELVHSGAKCATPIPDTRGVGARDRRASWSVEIPAMTRRLVCSVFRRRTTSANLSAPSLSRSDRGCAAPRSCASWPHRPWSH